MPHSSTAVAAALLLAVTACGSMHVETDHDPTADFTRYQTFLFLPSAANTARSTEFISPFLGKHVEAAIIKYLGEKGLVPAQGQNPDLYVGYHSVSSSEEGRLQVDLIDARTKQLVFRGKAEDEILDQQDAIDKIDEAVKQIFSDYPPKPGK
ncbi:MAG TPA: DUF4136 domain-containing protein [Gemmatimonadaceae bacterium]|nr:DUF4136 domain-containing protein [Gemmatimonadaceae bacterium]